MVNQLAEARPAENVTRARCLVAARPDDRRGLGERRGKGGAKGRRQRQPAGPEGAEALGRVLTGGNEAPEGRVDRVHAGRFEA